MWAGLPRDEEGGVPARIEVARGGVDIVLELPDNKEQKKILLCLIIIWLNMWL